MPEEVAGNLVFHIGGWIAVTGFVLLSVIRGYLVPKRTIDWIVQRYVSELNRKDTELHEVKTANQTLRDTLTLTLKNQNELVQAVQMNNSLIEEFRKAVQG